MAAVSMRFVHPIERLRAVARAGWAGPTVLAAEAAWALADLAEHEAPAVLPACRRLLDHHPDCGPLWWVAARVLTAGDQVEEGQWCGDVLESDPTSDVLDDMASEGERVVRRGGMGEVAAATAVVVTASAIGPGGMVVDGDALGILAAARAAEVPVWVEGGVGRVLPARLWNAMIERAEGAEHMRAGVLADLNGVTLVIGPNGAQPLAVALASTDCPEPAELLAGW
jgi:hypothetical protein